MLERSPLTCSGDEVFVFVCILYLHFVFASVCCMCGMLLGVGGSPLAQRTTSLYLFFFGNIWSEIPQSVQLGHPGQCFSQPHQNIHENVGMKLFRFKISGGEEVTFSLHS